MFGSFQEYCENLKNQSEGVEFDQEELSNQELMDLLKSINEGSLNESVFRKLFGAATGVILGREIMLMLLKVLNIESGVFYNILTSKTVLARVGYEFGRAECSLLIKVNIHIWRK